MSNEEILAVIDLLIPLIENPLSNSYLYTRGICFLADQHLNIDLYFQEWVNLHMPPDSMHWFPTMQFSSMSFSDAWKPRLELLKKLRKKYGEK